MIKKFVDIIGKCDVEKGWFLPLEDYCTNFSPKTFSAKEILKLYSYLVENKDVHGIPDYQDIEPAIVHYEQNQEILILLADAFPCRETIRLLSKSVLHSFSPEVLNALHWLSKSKQVPEDIRKQAATASESIRDQVNNILNQITTEVDNFDQSWKCRYPQSQLVFSLRNGKGRIFAKEFKSLIFLEISIHSEPPKIIELETAVDIEEHYEEYLEQAVSLTYSSTANYKTVPKDCYISIDPDEPKSFKMEIFDGHDSFFYSCRNGLVTEA